MGGSIALCSHLLIKGTFRKKGGYSIMINLMIADDNFYYAKKLMSYINENSKEIRVCYIASDGKETLEILNRTDEIDIVLLDLKMPIYTGIEIIKMLTPEQRIKYKHSFIIISGDDFLMHSKELKNEVIYRVLPKNLNMYNIISHINDLALDKKINNEELKISIIKELVDLGYDISHKGTMYLIESICMLIIRGDSIAGNLNKKVYPTIAKKYNQSVNNIKSNVIRATEAMFYNCEERKFKEYFSYYDLRKPNIKTVISTVIAKICEAKIKENSMKQ